MRAVALALVVVLVREAGVVAGSYALLGEAGTLGIQLACAALVLAAALRPGAERLPWCFVAGGMLAWTVGDVYTLVALAGDPAPPVPSPADAGYLLFPPLVFAGLVSLLRRRVDGASRFMWVDGLVAALAVAALSAAVVVEAVLGTVGGSPLATITTLAYALSDLVLLGFVAAAAALTGWRLDRTWACIGAGLVAFWLADSIFLLETAAGTYGYPDPIDGIWDVAFVALAAAAWQPAARPRPADGAAPGVRHVALPLVFGASGIALLAYGGLHAVTPLAVALATLSLCGVMVRLALTFRENRTLLDAARFDALTDALTGLGNRRAFARDLDAALAGGPDATPVLLVLLDLDGFKHYNDTFGHPAGDALLRRLAFALAARLAPFGTTYRIGGDEFCALLRLDAGPEAGELVALATEALGERGDGFSITASCGAARIPADGHEADVVLRLVDQRLYNRKQHGRTSAGRQSTDVLLRALVARHPALGNHSAGVADLAAATAQELGLDAAAVERVRSAAHLHDIGKVGIPDAILEKRGPLGPDERAYVQRHTVIGERIIAAAPSLAEVAPAVRSSHERWDGAGYPDGLAGEAIPLAARIVAVADTFDAMTSDRPYAAARSDEEALAELRRCAGTQFDPAVVRAFCVAYDRVLVAA